MAFRKYPAIHELEICHGKGGIDGPAGLANAVYTTLYNALHHNLLVGINPVNMFANKCLKFWVPCLLHIYMYV